MFRLLSMLWGALYFIVMGRRPRRPVAEGDRQKGAAASSAESSMPGALPLDELEADEATPHTLAEPPMEEDRELPNAAQAEVPVEEEAAQAAAEVPQTADLPAAWVMFRSGNSEGQTVPIVGSSTRVGRDPQNDLVIDDPAVSRTHARIEFDGREFSLTDSGSSSGTLVEGSPIGESTLLESGTAFKLGETELVFMREVEAPAPSEPSAHDVDSTLVPEQPSKLNAWLAVTKGASKGSICQVNVGQTVIGRDRESDLRINDSLASSRHALVAAGERGMVLIDLGSTNGTAVNGSPVRGVEARNGDVISAGETELLIVETARTSPGDPQPDDVDSTIVATDGSAAEQVAMLVVQAGPDAQKTFPLREGDSSLGRGDSDIALSDPTVSQLHALIRKHGHRYTIFDLGSKAGTRVSGNSVEGRRIEGGDMIAIGQSEIAVMEPGNE